MTDQGYFIGATKIDAEMTPDAIETLRRLVAPLLPHGWDHKFVAEYFDIGPQLALLVGTADRRLALRETLPPYTRRCDITGLVLREMLPPYIWRCDITGLVRGMAETFRRQIERDATDKDAA